jgi:hypothetical protein
MIITKTIKTILEAAKANTKMKMIEISMLKIKQIVDNVVWF